MFVALRLNSFSNISFVFASSFSPQALLFFRA